jgi:predicted SprT family Zn-dependent metalloprotease
MDIKEAFDLAMSHMTTHNLFDMGYSFEFDNAKRRFGCCNYRRKVISLSKHLTVMNDFIEVNDVILHEIAHALTKGHHHDAVWKAKAIEIGADGNRCYDSARVKAPEKKYEAICPGCQRKVGRHRKPRTQLSCGKCSKGHFNTNFLLDFKIKLGS